MIKIVKEPEEDFKFSARWIAPQKAECYFDTRTEFYLESVPEHTLLRITADYTYHLEINGIVCGHGPIRGTVRLQYFDTIDVADALKPGKNTVMVRVHSPAKPDFITSPVTPALLLELPGIVKTDTNWQVRTLPEWKSNVPLFTLQTGVMEYRDFRVAPGEWESAVEVTNPRLLSKKLVPRDIPALDIFTVRPTDISAMAELPAGDADSLENLAAFLNQEKWLPMPENRFDGSVIQPSCSAAIVWDFAGEWIGQLKLEIEAPAGTIVDVTYGEEPWHDGRLRALFPRDENIYRFTDRYILKAGRNTIGTTMTERGFRYIQVIFRNFAEPIRINDISAEVLRYPYVDRGAFHCSDPLLNAVYAQCTETMKACTTDIFLDCPWRERAFWINDLVVENRTSLAAFGASAVHKRAFDLAFSQQNEAGLVPGLCPQPPDANFVLPSTNFFLVMMLDDYLKFSGDTDTVRRHLAGVEKIFENFESRVDTDGLTCSPPELWNFYDWGFELDCLSFSGLRESMINSLYVYAMKLFIRLADAVKYQSPHIQEYGSRIARTSMAIERVFRDKTSGCIADPVIRKNTQAIMVREGVQGTISSQLSHAMVLLAGVGSDSLKESCIKALTDENIHIPEFYLHDFVLMAMSRNGLVRQGVERVRKYWGPMAMTGLPAVYEAGIHEVGRASMDDTGSLCHGFATAPVAFLQNGVLGVTLTSDKTFDFRPDLAGLEFAEGRIPAAYGNISVRLNVAGAEIRIPLNCEAKLKNDRILKGGCHKLNWEELT